MKILSRNSHPCTAPNSIPANKRSKQAKWLRPTPPNSSAQRCRSHQQNPHARQDPIRIARCRNKTKEEKKIEKREYRICTMERFSRRPKVADQRPPRQRRHCRKCTKRTDAVKGVYSHATSYKFKELHMMEGEEMERRSLGNRFYITRLLFCEETLERGEATPLGQPLGQHICIARQGGMRTVGQVGRLQKRVGLLESGRRCCAAELIGSRTLWSAKVSARKQAKLCRLSRRHGRG